jgi:hypothetical protein
MDNDLIKFAHSLMTQGILTYEVALFLLEMKLFQLWEREMVKGAGFGDSLVTVEKALLAISEGTFPEPVFLSFKKTLEQSARQKIK